MTLQFNTLKFRKDLIKNGMSEELAETVINGLHSVTTDHLATKADLVELKAELQTDMKWIKVFILLVIGGLAKLIFFP